MVGEAEAQPPGGDHPGRYDVFISYSRKDTPFVAHLERALEAYKAPVSLGLARRRLDVFRDAEDLSGPEYSQSIRECLARSTKLLVVCSTHARQSAYVDQEIAWFLETHEPADVIALLLEGLPNNEVGADDPRRAFPAQLCKAHAIPLAADYRGFSARNKASRAPFEGPWFTLLANIFAIDRSTLEQRERQRQRRERRIVAAIVGSVMAGLAAAAVFSWIQMRRAEEQRDIAVKGFARYLAMNSDEVAATAPEIALLLAVESARTTHDLDKTVTAEAETALRWSLSNAGGRRLGTGTRGLSFSPDGHWVVRSLDDGERTVWDLSNAASLPAAVTVPKVVSAQPGPADELAAIVAGEPSRIALLDMKDLNRPPRWIEPRAIPTSVQFSADGATLLISSSTADLQVLDLNGSETTPSLLRGHRPRRIDDSLRGIRAATLSPGGRWIASAGYDNVLLLWSARAPNAAPQQLLTGVEADTPLLSDDDRWLRVTTSPPSKPGKPAAATDNLWYLGGAAPQRVPIEAAPADGTKRVSDLTSERVERFMPGDHFITDRGGGTTLLWKLDASMARIERRIEGTLAGADGSHFVTIARTADAASSYELTLWDVNEAESVDQVELDGASMLRAVVYSEATGTLAALTADELLTWALVEGRLSDTPQRHAGIDGNKLELVPGGRAVLVANWYSVARIWSLENPSLDPVRVGVEPTAELQRAIRTSSTSSEENGTPPGGLQQTLAFDSRSQRVAFAGDDGNVAIVDLQRPNDPPSLVNVSDDPVSAVGFSPDGGKIAAANRKLLIGVWGTAERAKPLVQMQMPEQEGSTSSLTALVFSPSGNLLAAGAAFGSVAVWNLAKPGAEPRKFTDHKAWITSVAFSKDEKLLLVGGDDGKASLVSLADPGSVRLLEGHAGGVAAAFMDDDQSIVTAGQDATVRIWSVRDADAKPRILRGHNSEIVTFAPVPHGQRLVTVSRESLRVWDLAAPERPPFVMLLSEPIDVVSVSHDGRWLAAANAGGGIDVRRMDALDQPPMRMPATQATGALPVAFAVQFSPDDRWLGALTQGQGWLWRTQPEALMQLACEASGRNFEASEWEQYLPDQAYRLTCAQWGLGPDYLKYARTEAERTAIDHATKLFTRARELVPELTFDPAAEARRLGVANVLKSGRDNARDQRQDSALVQLGRIREIDPASSIDPEQEIARVQQARELVVKGTSQAEAGQLEPAAAVFREALRLDPGLAEPDSSDPRLNLDPVRRAHQVYAATIVRQGLALAADGKVPEAVEQLKRAIEIDPGALVDTPEADANHAHAKALVSKAESLADATGDLEGTISGYRAALAVDPELGVDPETEARSRVAIYWLRKARSGDSVPDSIRYFEQALALDPGAYVDSVASDLCRSALREGFAKNAMRVCSMPAEHDEKSVSAHRDRAQARALTGDSRGAISDFELVVSKSGDTSDVEQIKQWIRKLKTGWHPRAYAELGED